MRNLRMHWRRFRNLQELVYHGVRIGTVPGEIPKSVRSALFKGTYEDYECRLVERCVKPGDRVLEIGTGIGVVSLLATRLAGEGNVLSCEANPALEPVIRANYARNGWQPELLMTAVTADGRDLSFHQNDNLLTSSAHDRSLAGTAITVPSTPIDTLIARHRPSVLVMDVEGSETELLPAADLSGIASIIVEMHPHIVGEDAIAELGAKLQARGLREAARQHKTCLLVR